MRDPRNDPKSGDVVKAAGGVATVLAVEGDEVKYEVDSGTRESNVHGKVSLAFWRSRANDFEVVKVAE